ncbi:cardiolipin synthase [Gracilibacillus caseinilyticus]|uniref:Cardiolipin synthase n=1 Tax=Gracilibacillus caseinilyticus TaxID=2932256 RepID=A0ABY4EUW5_9BACI|nr:cardiolipin synthase [Gracilibacillus caseinilyticus]UOQ48204.1 cardiolipin synthase [Gracilibacillus caseinilyticus]
MDTSSIIALVVSIITVFNIILSAGVLFFERRDIGYTWAWLLVLLFIPIAGFVIYIFFGRKVQQKNFYHLTAEEKHFLQSEVDQQFRMIEEKKQNSSFYFQKYAALIQMNLRSSNSLITTDNDIQIYHDGQAKFDALFHDINKAKKEINIQYYIIQTDSLGKKLRDILTEKAKNGVKIRLLYDEIGSKKISPHFFQSLRSVGGEVEVFFPSIIRPINFRINNRNHRKLCIIDGEVAYIGGFNVGDEYLGHNKKFGYWRDTHLRITGHAVNDIQVRFFLDWRQAGKHKKGFSDHFLFNQAEPAGDIPLQIVSSGPNSRTEHLKIMYMKLIQGAKETVLIQTPYFIPDNSFMDACKMALLAGVDLQIMIPNKPDHIFVYWATWAHAAELLDYGAKILLYEKGFLHAKTIVVDGEVASVGTMNIDSRSFRLNFEVNAIVYQKEIAQQLYDMFQEDRNYCSEITIERYKKRSTIIKIKEGISRLLSPIL